MNWGKVAIGICVFVWSLIMLVVGKIWGSAEGEKDRRKMNAENEKLRRQIRAVLRTFKGEMAKKDEEIKWLDGIIDQLIKSPPANMQELARRLRSLGLTDSQIENVEARMAPIYKS